MSLKEIGLLILILVIVIVMCLCYKNKKNRGVNVAAVEAKQKEQQEQNVAIPVPVRLPYNMVVPSHSGRWADPHPHPSLVLEPLERSLSSSVVPQVHSQCFIQVPYEGKIRN